MHVLISSRGSQIAWHLPLTLFLLCLSGCDATGGKVQESARARAQISTHPAKALPATVSANLTSQVAASPTGTVFRFRNVAREWGVQFNRYDDMRGENRNMEAHGGGIAVLDFDLDGQLDLFFTQGAKLPLKNFAQELSNQMFRNRGDLKGVQTDVRHFEDVTAATELTAMAFHTGCAVGDVDADGFPDLYLTAYGQSSLWLNAGDGTFRDVTATSHSASDTWGASVALADVNGDAWPDIYIATYLKVGDDPPLICRDARSPTGTVQCSPTIIPALDDLLFVNDGQGGFINVSNDAGITAPDGKGLGVLAIDVNADGKLDLHVANDTTPSFLYLNETSTKEASRIPGTEIIPPHFTDRGTEFGIALNGEGNATAAMGIAHGDYDRDGWIDLFVTNYYLEVNTLFHNQAGQGFIDFSSASRLGPPSRLTLAFGTEFLDVDHDGWLDLVVTTGHVEDGTWKGEPYRMRPLLFRNERNGRFTDVAATAGPYFTGQWVGRPLAIGDMDRDGDLDLVIGHQGDPSALLLNDTPAPNTSVIIKPVGRNGSPRDGIGAKITASGITPPLMQVLAGGGSFQSASAQEFHMPLANSKAFAELICEWPDGQKDQWFSVSPGYYVAVEGRGLFRIAD
jgi:hypothetical protein